MYIIFYDATKSIFFLLFQIEQPLFAAHPSHRLQEEGVDRIRNDYDDSPECKSANSANADSDQCQIIGDSGHGE